MAQNGKGKLMKTPIFILSGILFISIFGSSIYTIDPYQFDKNSILLPPSFAHIMGTDRLGRDILARVIQGSQISLSIGFISAMISSLIGLIVGISASYFRGILDKGIIFIIDIFLTFPTFFLLLALVSYIDTSAIILIIVISITGWMGLARLIRSESFKISSQPFIKILKLANIPTYKIFFKYFLPLLAPIFLVSFTFGVAGGILAESALSFLGLGVMPPSISCGLLISEGKSVLDIAWWISFFPGFMIFLVTYSLIKLSDEFQNYFNQKEKIS